MNLRRMTLVALPLLLLAACKATPDEAEEPSQEEATESQPGESEEVDEPGEEPEAAAEGQAEPPAEEGEAELPELPGEWEIVAAADLDDTQTEQLSRAQTARQQLMGRLVTRLTETMQAEGPVAAVRVCNEDAPEIRSGLAEEMDLRIGRTSFKLRNPNNTPPEWAAPLVDARVERPVVATGPDGVVAEMHPIRLGAPCVACHGPSEQIAPEVSAVIAERYPEDQATGFEEGDLRGWFWVEVPAEM